MRKYFGKKDKDAMSSKPDEYSTYTKKEDKQLHVLIDGQEYVRKNDVYHLHSNQQDKLVRLCYWGLLAGDGMPMGMYRVFGRKDDDFSKFMSNLSVSYNIYNHNETNAEIGKSILLYDYMDFIQNQLDYQIIGRIDDMISKQIILDRKLTDVRKLRMLVQALESICINTTLKVVINAENILIAAVQEYKLFNNTSGEDVNNDKWLALTCALDFLIKTTNIEYEYDKLGYIEKKIREHKIEIGYEDGYVYGIRIDNSTTIKLQELIEMLTISI